MAKLLGIDVEVFHIGGLKILHIGYITSIYIIIGFLYAILFESIYGQFNEAEEMKKSVFRQTLELISMLWFAAVCLFIVNHTAQKIPIPSYLIGYKYDELTHINEVQMSGILVFLFMFFQEHIFNKVRRNYILLTRSTDFLPNM